MLMTYFSEKGKKNLPSQNLFYHREEPDTMTIPSRHNFQSARLLVMFGVKVTTSTKSTIHRYPKERNWRLKPAASFSPNKNGYFYSHNSFKKHIVAIWGMGIYERVDLRYGLG